MPKVVKFREVDGHNVIQPTSSPPNQPVNPSSSQPANPSSNLPKNRKPRRSQGVTSSPSTSRDVSTVIDVAISQREEYQPTSNCTLGCPSFPFSIILAAQRLSAKAASRLSSYDDEEKLAKQGTMPEAIIYNILIDLGITEIRSKPQIERLVTLRNKVRSIDRVSYARYVEANMILSRWYISIPDLTMGGIGRKNIAMNEDVKARLYTLAERLGTDKYITGVLCMTMALCNEGGLLLEHKREMRRLREVFYNKVDMRIEMCKLFMRFVKPSRRVGGRIEGSSR